MANPQEGDTNLLLYWLNDPETGKVTASSPSAWTVQKIMIPVMKYAISRDAGPPEDSAEPEPTNRPVPMAPPILIIWICLDLRDLCNGDLADRMFAFSMSDKFGSTSICGSGLNESIKLLHPPLEVSSMAPTEWSEKVCSMGNFSSSCLSIAKLKEKF
ncbi:hypothetical protein OGAPHI_007200 [Ogataea philodendri]|uniref:Uncharacterized protein n=1 Tax=Ogataea philodendri TaxID=1378263 RepID=A0A9P8NUX3_9ASCO|nr:uncharacterized protein OGAPHI_007200 [Ogataea philodendri]KAH3659995.1 hypothetical protein OGAPHI_007200 [Ogataea philodendri]